MSPPVLGGCPGHWGESQQPSPGLPRMKQALHPNCSLGRPAQCSAHSWPRIKCFPAPFCPGCLVQALLGSALRRGQTTRLGSGLVNPRAHSARGSRGPEDGPVQVTQPGPHLLCGEREDT